MASQYDMKLCATVSNMVIPCISAKLVMKKILQGQGSFSNLRIEEKYCVFGISCFSCEKH